MQSVRFTRAADGLSLAWARSGSGPPLVKTSNWLTHLKHDQESPLWKHWITFLERHFDYLRYDERGCGMSDREPGALSLDVWLDDMERVIAASQIETPFALLGLSQGATTAIAYAHRHPERVSQLILFGGYARGTFCRGDDEAEILYRGILDVLRTGWHQPVPAFREVFTRKFVPDGPPDRIAWFNDLVLRTTGPDAAQALLLARAEIDVEPLLAEITCPTIVLHCEDDMAVPFEEGARIARGIPGAEFVALPGRNHILQVDEPAWAQFTDAVLSATGCAESAAPDLTLREREILDLICAALSNKAIARELGVSEKTVRNHATHLFAKLGVASRQEAILKMRGAA
ncbi:MAG: alpha/beta fold hydrolase [Pseudomonadota bacterium]